MVWPLMWQYLSLSAAKYGFNAPSPQANPTGFEDGVNWENGVLPFSVTCFVISIFIPKIVKMIGSRKKTFSMFLFYWGIWIFHHDAHTQ